MKNEKYSDFIKAQHMIIAAQQECEEICLQSDTPDYRALYFRLFAQTEQVRRDMEELLKE